MKLAVGLSPCPNDTFLFHGLLAGAVETEGLELELVLADVQELNERLARGALDAGKASFAQALRLAGEYGVLDCGSAIGAGVGPLLVAREPGPPPGPADEVLCPGAGTTAHLLLRLALPQVARVRHVRFDAIQPALARGDAAFGVVIHEGRFTYRGHGLHCRLDLGAWWEAEQGIELPLGGLLARRALGGEVHRRLVRVLRRSLAVARADRDGAFATMRRHAQELAPEAIWPHVELYVNELTGSLGERGMAALERFAAAARAAGLVARDAPPLERLGA